MRLLALGSPFHTGRVLHEEFVCRWPMSEVVIRIAKSLRFRVIDVRDNKHGDIVLEIDSTFLRYSPD